MLISSDSRMIFQNDQWEGVGLRGLRFSQGHEAARTVRVQPLVQSLCIGPLDIDIKLVVLKILYFTCGLDWILNFFNERAWLYPSKPVFSFSPILCLGISEN